MRLSLNSMPSFSHQGLFFPTKPSMSHCPPIKTSKSSILLSNQINGREKKIYLTTWEDLTYNTLEAIYTNTYIRSTDL